LNSVAFEYREARNGRYAIDANASRGAHDCSRIRGQRRYGQQTHQQHRHKLLNAYGQVTPLPNRLIVMYTGIILSPAGSSWCLVTLVTIFPVDLLVISSEVNRPFGLQEDSVSSSKLASLVLNSGDL